MPPRVPPQLHSATAVLAEGELADVRLDVGGRLWHLAGRGGGAAERERVLAALAEGGMPVLLGAGLGAGLAAARAQYAGPIFVLDREPAIAAATGVRAAFAADALVHFCDDADPDRAAGRVIEAARSAGFARLAVVVHPIYPRLRPDWYGAVQARLTGYAALRDRLTAPRFTAPTPKVLLLWRPYFLYREIETALTRCAIPYHRLATGTGKRGESDVVAAILEAVATFRPDFALTVNHLGLDRDGKLAGLLADIGLPLASWFVDSPRLILHDHPGLATPSTMVFTYDADTLPELAAMGYARTAWLPLATDPDRFRPGRQPLPTGHPWRGAVSFVGASMEEQAATERHCLPADTAMARLLDRAADDFITAPQHSARLFFQEQPPLWQAYAALPSSEARLHAELALTWEATRRYRQACVRALLPFTPLIAGDAGWQRVLPAPGRQWHPVGSLDYYDDLPRWYPASDINFNCTSLQMKGAVNQRAFDVPACGGFVLTDDREQLARLFTPGKEAAIYAGIEEIPDQIRHYLAHPEARRRIGEAARTRILAEHTYAHRIQTLCATMRRAFGD